MASSSVSNSTASGLRRASSAPVSSRPRPAPALKSPSTAMRNGRFALHVGGDLPMRPKSGLKLSAMVRSPWKCVVDRR